MAGVTLRPVRRESSRGERCARHVLLMTRARTVARASLEPRRRDTDLGFVTMVKPLSPPCPSTCKCGFRSRSAGGVSSDHDLLSVFCRAPRVAPIEGVRSVGFGHKPGVVGCRIHVCRTATNAETGERNRENYHTLQRTEKPPGRSFPPLDQTHRVA